MAAEAPLPVAEAEAAALFAGLETESSVAVAVSGGPDSIALAGLLSRWRANRGAAPRLHALVVDHGLRAGSDREAQSTVRTLKALQLPVTVLTLSGLPRSNLHAAARIARYDAMTAWMARNGFSLLLTGHHRDDQIETVAMRLARDEEAGLAGIPAHGWWADMRLARPLLAVTRARLMATARQMALGFVCDPSNEDPRFERARVRALLAAGEAPLPVTAIAARQRTAALADARSDADALALAGKALHLLPEAIALLDIDRFCDGSQAVRQRVLRSLVRDMGGATAPPARGKIARLDAALCSSAHGSCKAGFAGATLAGVRFQRALGHDRHRQIVISRETGRRVLAPMPLAAGTAVLFDRRFRVVCGSNIAGGLHAATGAPRAFAQAALGDMRLPAAALAAMPAVFGPAGPLFPLVGAAAGEAGITAAFTGIRFGAGRLCPAR